MLTAIDRRAKDMVALLNGDKTSSGFVVVDGIVVVRYASWPYTHKPTVYEEPVLRRAVELNLVEKSKMVNEPVSVVAEWEWYTLK